MDFDMASEVFSALGDPHRLKALHFLATATPDCCQGPDGVCACDLVTHLDPGGAGHGHKAWPLGALRPEC
jgi:DNA-binding transcriptional ArsR family regulator